ncbi:hypothetical protein DPMN_131649 [Dreissena polymorpha]|uniref:Uncharacterized protein n=1 Tax=Dreissena polymorpha TaxID=45954 RepID=A0A9D4J9C8_DREPO|nr:hypothetical protein DPMN_131649 [Dreissena polymorpha]
MKEDGNQAAFTFINGPGIDRVLIRDFQGSSADSVGADSDRTDGQKKRRSVQYPHAFKADNNPNLRISQSGKEIHNESITHCANEHVAFKKRWPKRIRPIFA